MKGFSALGSGLFGFQPFRDPVKRIWSISRLGGELWGSQGLEYIGVYYGVPLFRETTS